MRTVYDYEHWLDSLDAQIYIRQGWLISEFGERFSVLVRDVDSPEKLAATTMAFRASLGESPDGGTYLIKRLYWLLDEKHHYGRKFSLTADQFVAQMEASWNGFRPPEQAPAA